MFDKFKKRFDIGLNPEQKKRKKNRSTIRNVLIGGVSILGVGGLALIASNFDAVKSGVNDFFTTTLGEAIQKAPNIKDQLESLLPDFFDYGEIQDINDILDQLDDMEIALNFGNIEDIADAIEEAAQEIWEEQFEDMIPEGTWGESFILDGGRVIR